MRESSKLASTPTPSYETGTAQARATAATVNAATATAVNAATATAAVNNNSTATVVPTLIIDIPQSNLDVVLDAPRVMRKDTSYAIQIALAPKGKPLVSNLKIEGAATTASGTVAVGTPGVTLREAFGQGFEAPFGEAKLNSSTFDLEPNGPEKRPLDQPRVVWGWSVTPRSQGTQYLTVTSNATWTAANGVERGPYEVGSRTFRIDVEDAFIVPGHFDLGATLTAVLVALLSPGGLGSLLILWLGSMLILWFVRRRRRSGGGENAASAGRQGTTEGGVTRGRQPPARPGRRRDRKRRH